MFSYKTIKCHFQNKPLSTLFKTNQNMPISSLFFEINQNTSNSTSSLLNSHIDTLPQHTKSLSHHFSPLHPSGSNSTYWHIIYYSSCQFSTTPIPINHYCTQSTSYSPSTWFNPQFNHNQSSSIYHNMHISLTSYHQDIINHHYIYDHIIYINNSTTSTIQCLS